MVIVLGLCTRQRPNIPGRPTPPGAEDSFRELTTTAQLSNVSDYQGYRLTTILGFELSRINPGGAFRDHHAELHHHLRGGGAVRLSGFR